MKSLKMKSLKNFFNSKAGVALFAILASINILLLLFNIIVPFIGTIWAGLIYVLEGVDTKYQPEFDVSAGIISIFFIAIFSIYFIAKKTILIKLWRDLLNYFEKL